MFNMSDFLLVPRIIQKITLHVILISPKVPDVSFNFLHFPTQRVYIRDREEKSRE